MSQLINSSTLHPSKHTQEEPAPTRFSDGDDLQDVLSSLCLELENREHELSVATSIGKTLLAHKNEAEAALCALQGKSAKQPDHEALTAQLEELATEVEQCQHRLLEMGGLLHTAATETAATQARLQRAEEESQLASQREASLADELFELRKMHETTCGSRIAQLENEVTQLRDTVVKKEAQRLEAQAMLRSVACEAEEASARATMHANSRQEEPHSASLKLPPTVCEQGLRVVQVVKFWFARHGKLASLILIPVLLTCCISVISLICFYAGLIFPPACILLGRRRACGIVTEPWFALGGVLASLLPTLEDWVKPPSRPTSATSSPARFGSPRRKLEVVAESPQERH